MKKLLLILYFGMGCFNYLLAQNNCAENLIRANTYFEQGKIEEAIAIAKTCATSSNSVTEKWQAYRILAMSYLINNQPDEARKAAEQMLELNPTYKPSLLKDPKNFIVLLNSISVIPKFSLGLAVSTGANITYPYVTASYNGADYNKIYTSQQSYQFGVLTGYNINEVLSVHAGLMASTKKYSIDYTYLNWNFKVSEKISHLEIPCFMRYTILPKNNLKFYLDAGAFGGTLIKSMNTFQRSTLDMVENSIVKNYDATNRRNKMVYGLVMGGGIIYKVGKGLLSLDVKYAHSFANITNVTDRYKHSTLFYKYYFLDDDLRLNNLAVSLGYSIYLNYRVIKS